MPRFIAFRIQHFSLLVIASAGVAQPASSRDHTVTGCSENFVVSGNAAEGYSFRTFQQRPRPEPSAVLGRAGRTLASMGFAISEIHSEFGIISSSAQNGAVTLNVIVSPVGGEPSGTRMEAVVQLRASATSPPAVVRRELCELIEASFGS